MISYLLVRVEVEIMPAGQVKAFALLVVWRFRPAGHGPYSILLLVCKCRWALQKTVESPTYLILITPSWIKIKGVISDYEIIASTWTFLSHSMANSPICTLKPFNNSYDNDTHVEILRLSAGGSWNNKTIGIKRNHKIHYIKHIKLCFYL